MDQIKRKRNIWNRRERRRAWAALSILWLVAACLAGCGQSRSGQAETQVGTRIVDAQTAVQGQEFDPGSAATEEERFVVDNKETGDVGEEAVMSGGEAGNRQAGVAAAGQEIEPESGEKTDTTEQKSVAAGQDAGNHEEKSAATGQDSENHGAYKDSNGKDLEKESETQEVPSSLSPVEAAESAAEEAEESTPEESTLTVEESGSYTSKEEVALYIHLYGRLPGNYITKKQAEKLGWDSKAGNLWKVAPGMSIGGSRFGNYEGALPDKKGRTYYECDIDYDGGYRGAKRIIYSNDGLIYYTEDHYKTFEELYGQ